MAQTYSFKPLQNGVTATIFCVLIALGLAVGADPKTGAGALTLWPVFAASNQLLASLSLLALTIFLAKLGRNYWVSFIPMMFVAVMTCWGALISLGNFYNGNQFLQFSVALVIFVISVWMMLEGLYALRTRIQSGKPPMAAAGDD